jgi:hypothetical protein
MSLTLTPLATDNFTRTNVSPLASPWTLNIAGDAGLQIVSNLCEGTSNDAYCGQFYDYADLPDDQYASITVAQMGSEGSFEMFVRSTDTGVTFGSQDTTGYLFTYYNGRWSVGSVVGGPLMSGPMTVNSGDGCTLAAVGTTIYAFQNSTLLGSATDTTYASGITLLVLAPYPTLNTVQVSNFAMGSAAVAGPTPTPDVPTDPYLGCCTLTNGGADPQPGQSGVVYVGCVRIVAAPRSGSIPHPYLGHFTLFSAPPAGFPNPGAFLGEVTVVASPPNGARPIPLGQVKQVN